MQVGSDYRDRFIAHTNVVENNGTSIWYFTTLSIPNSTIATPAELRRRARDCFVVAEGWKSSNIGSVMGAR